MSQAVEMRGISKQFGRVQALDNVGLTVESGSIHGVVGENGAGKSTLMKVLYGAYQADSGEVRVNGKAVNIRSSKEAIALGIGMVSQHYGIVPELTLLDNLILGAEPSVVLDKGKIRERASKIAASIGLDYGPEIWDRDASAMSASDAQRLEILKLLWREAKIMILDEPTAMLSPKDGEALFGSLRALTKEGATVLLVTHRLPEIMEYCDRVTVLRGGKWIADVPVSEANPEMLSELIVGRTLSASERPKPIAPTPPVLEVKSLSVARDRGTDAVQKASFELSPGELVGIAGVDGSGQAELFRALLGVTPIREGGMLWHGKAISNEPTEKRIELGWRILPEDRLQEAIISDWSLIENSTLGLHRLPEFSDGGKVRVPERAAFAQKAAEKFGTKHGGLETSIGGLSGGNQQRFVAARMTESGPKLFLAFQPSRGLDIAATEDLYAAMQERCREGAAGLVVSFDLDELMAHCHRVLVMFSGRVVVPPADADRDTLGRLMVGGEA